MVKARTPLLSIKQCHGPFSTAVVSMGIVVINCIRCPNYFFQDCRPTADGGMDDILECHPLLIQACMTLVLLSTADRVSLGARDDKHIQCSYQLHC